jgi:hypothetical protein
MGITVKSFVELLGLQVTSLFWSSARKIDEKSFKHLIESPSLLSSWPDVRVMNDAGSGEIHIPISAPAQLSPRCDHRCTAACDWALGIKRNLAQHHPYA